MAKAAKVARSLYAVEQRTVNKSDAKPELGTREVWAVVRVEDGKMLAAHGGPHGEENAEHQADALEARANR